VKSQLAKNNEIKVTDFDHDDSESDSVDESLVIRPKDARYAPSQVFPASMFNLTRPDPPRNLILPTVTSSFRTIVEVVGGTTLRRKHYFSHSKEIGSDVFHQFIPYVTDPRDVVYTNDSYIVNTGLIFFESNALYTTGSLFTHYGHCITVGDAITNNSSRFYVQKCVGYPTVLLRLSNQLDCRPLTAIVNRALYICEN
ncbi:hypothetical protein HDU97_007322, partial [Phlyctochytrium planicorne]